MANKPHKMKIEHKIILVSIVLGLAMWVLDSLVDYLFFFQGTFMQSFFTMVAPHDAYLRVAIMIVFPVFGVIIAGIVSKLRRMKDALNESERALRDIINFDNVVLTTIPFGIEVVDEKHNILFMNKTMQEFTGRQYLGGKCYEMVRDSQQRCPGCPLENGIKFGRPECIEVEDVFGRKKFRIIYTGMFYNGREAILEIFQDMEEFKTCKVARATKIDVARIRDAVRSGKEEKPAEGEAAP